jgi:hypothetical protein
MDGSGLSLILIPIVVSISLAAWLILVYYADAHPSGTKGSPLAGTKVPARLERLRRPDQRQPDRADVAVVRRRGATNGIGGFNGDLDAIRLP